HVSLLVYSLNRLYALPLPHRLLTSFRLLHGLLALAGVGLFCWVLGPGGIPAAWRLDGWSGAALLAAYATVCAGVGLVLLPLVTLQRHLRRSPAALLSNHTRTVDVAKELGFVPSGRGKHRALTRLPGNEVFRVDFAERTLSLPRLPDAWDGLTI